MQFYISKNHHSSHRAYTNNKFLIRAKINNQLQIKVERELSIIQRTNNSIFGLVL